MLAGASESPTSPEPPRSGAPRSAAFARRARLFAGAGVALLAAGALAVYLHRGRAKALELTRPLERLEARATALRGKKAKTRLRSACTEKNCGCVTEASRIGLDVDAAKETLELLEAGARGCDSETLAGYRAEALALLNRDDQAEREARETLIQRPDDPHANYALALASFHRGRTEEASTHARRAAELERGAPAHMLEGLIAFHRGDFEGAKRAFQRAAERDPDDPRIRYNLGLAAHKQDRYGEARRNYLLATRLDRKHADARYNLVLLTHSAGAVEEAKHHLRALEAIDPRGELVAKARAAIAALPARGMALTLPGGSVAAPAGSAAVTSSSPAASVRAGSAP